MPGLYIRTVDIKGDSPTKSVEVMRTHRGDVIVAKPNGWPWSQQERTNSSHRIVEVDITNSEADALTKPEFNILDTKQQYWTRGRRLDLDSVLITGKFKDYLADDTRATQIFEFTGNPALISSITETKQDADDYLAGI